MIKLSLVIRLLKHRFKAKTRHGVHSPFVYRLVDQVIYDFHAKTVYQDIEQLRKDLLHDKRSIVIAGPDLKSQAENIKQKQIRFLAETTFKPVRLSRLIHRLASDLKPRNIIELGACMGIVTAYLAKAVPESRIISIEGCAETVTIASENLQKLSIQNVEVLAGSADELLPKLIEEIHELDFIFINGNHSRNTILNYFKWCLPKLSENSVMILDDIYKSKEMEAAWEEIKARPEVSVTIDLFWIGLVFVRKAQAKEDFKIRV